MSYLLGRLSEEERSDCEELFFSDDQEFEQLLIAETELIDKYIRNELSVADRKNFEKTLTTSPRLAERVELGTLLMSRLSGLSAPEKSLPESPSIKPKPAVQWWRNFLPSFRQPAFAFSVLLLLLTGSLLAFVWTRYRTQSQLLSKEAEQRQKLENDIAQLKSRGDQLDQNLQQAIREREELLTKLQSQQSGEKPATAPSMLLSLLPGSVRGGSGKVFHVPANTSSVTLDFDVSDGDYSRYSATLKTIDGRVVMRSSALKVSQIHEKKSVRVKLDAASLPPGDYIGQLEGVTKNGKETFNYYPFRIGPK